LSVIRPVSTILAEQYDEWQDSRPCFRPESMALIDAAPAPEGVVPTMLLAS
jgi:hypothetical protein